MFNKKNKKKESFDWVISFVRIMVTVIIFILPLALYAMHFGGEYNDIGKPDSFFAAPIDETLKPSCPICENCKFGRQTEYQFSGKESSCYDCLYNSSCKKGFSCQEYKCVAN